MPSRDIDRTLTLPKLPEKMEDIIPYLAQLHQALAAAHDELATRINELDEVVPEWGLEEKMKEIVKGNSA